MKTPRIDILHPTVHSTVDGKYETMDAPHLSISLMYTY